MAGVDTSGAVTVASTPSSESDLLSADALAAKTTPTELVPSLKEIHDALKRLEQGHRTNGLEQFAVELADDRLLKTHSKEVRVLLACCLADVVRIFAPSLPYNDKKIRSIFTFFVRQLRSIEDLESPFWSWTYYLLEKLSLVKAFVVVADDENLIVRTFDCILSSVSERHSHKVVTQMQNILLSILHETTQPVPPWLLEALLQHLVVDKQAAGVDLTIKVVRSCSTLLQSPISNFLNSLLARDGSMQSDLSEYRGDLIVALNRVSTDFLIYVLPNLERELTSTNEANRKEAMSVLGRIFSASESSAVKDYPSLFKAFLGRMTDVDASIRKQACILVPRIVEMQPFTAIDAFNVLDARLLDSDAEVRQAAVQAVFQLAPQAGTQSLVDAASRMMDKDVATRQTAIQSITKCLEIEIRKYAGTGASGSIFRLDEKVGWMPGMLVRTSRTLANTGDVASVHLIERAIFDRLLLCDAPLERRVEIWLAVFEGLDDVQRRAFAGLISTRASFRKLFKEALELITRRGEDADPVMGEENGPLSALTTSLGKCLPAIPVSRGNTVPATKLLREVFTSANENLCRKLHLVCNEKLDCNDVQEAVSAAEAVAQKSDVKLFVAEYLVPRCRAGIFSEEHLRRMARIVTQENPSAGVAPDFTAWFLGQAAALYPEAFEGVSETIANLLLNPSTSTLPLRLLASMGDCFHVRSAQLTAVNQKLIELSQIESFDDEAKWAARALTKMNGDDAGLSVWARLLPSLQQKLKRFESNPSTILLAGPLMSFAEFSSKSPEVWSLCQEEIVNFCLKFLGGEFKVPKSSKFGVCCASAIKILSHATVAAVKEKEGEKRGIDERRVCSLLIRTIKKLGDVFDSFESEDECLEDTQCALVRLAAASAVLRISRALEKKAFLVLSPSDYLTTALTAQDANPDVRLSFAKKIYDGILHKRLQLRWVVGLILMAIDPDKENMDAVRKYTATLVKIWKLKVEDFKRTEGKDDIRTILPLLPECVLPSVIWILSHHPDILVDSEADFPETRKYLEFFFTRLLAQTDYASFLVQILQTIVLSEDATDSREERAAEGNKTEGTALTRTVASMGLEILKGLQSGRRWDLSEYPGRFFLPEELYRTNKVRKSLHKAARELDEAKLNQGAGNRNVKTGEEDRRERPSSRADRGRKESRPSRRSRRRREDRPDGDREDKDNRGTGAVPSQTEHAIDQENTQSADEQTMQAPDTIAGRASRRRRVSSNGRSSKTLETAHPGKENEPDERVSNASSTRRERFTRKPRSGTENKRASRREEVEIGKGIPEPGLKEFEHPRPLPTVETTSTSEKLEATGVQNDAGSALRIGPEDAKDSGSNEGVRSTGRRAIKRPRRYDDGGDVNMSPAAKRMAAGRQGKTQ